MTVLQSNTEEALVDESVSSMCQEGCNAMYHKQRNHQGVNHFFFFFLSNSGVARRKTSTYKHTLPVTPFRKARPGKAELVELDGGWQVISAGGRHGRQTGTDTTKTHTHTATAPRVSNDEVNFIKQRMRGEKVEDVVIFFFFSRGHALFMLSAETLVKSQECK